MNCILIGLGEIGKAIQEYYGKFHTIHTYDIKYGNVIHSYLKQYDLMLVAMPYDENFVSVVNKYKETYDVKDTIIFSTVPIGTTSKIENAVHSPIEGKHPNLAESIEYWKVFIGGINKQAERFFGEADKIIFTLDKPEHTEFLKLQSTTNYGLMIEYARYVKSVCDKIGMDYNFVKLFNIEYNDLYEKLCMDQFKRYILEAPNGKIGGHCVVPNAKILNSQFPNEILNQIIK